MFYYLLYNEVGHAMCINRDKANMIAKEVENIYINCEKAKKF